MRDGLRGRHRNVNNCKNNTEQVTRTLVFTIAYIRPFYFFDEFGVQVVRASGGWTCASA